MAKRGIIGIGAFFLAITIIGYIFPYNEIGWTIPHGATMCNSGIGQGGHIIDDVDRFCVDFNNILLGINSSGFLGIVLIIVGIVIPSKKEINQ